MKKNYKIAILILVLGMLIGLVIAQGTIFTFMYFAIVTSLFIGITVLTGISDLFTKKRNFVYPGYPSLVLIVSFGIGILGLKVIQTKNQNTAEQVILELNNYRMDNGTYPNELSDLIQNEEKFTDLYYSPDSAGETYYLGYSLDGWHLKEYSSKTKKWNVRD